MTDTASAHWYMINKMGTATLCADREDAELEAAIAQTAWPTAGPYRAVQMVELSIGGAGADKTTPYVRAAESRAYAKGYAAGRKRREADEKAAPPAVVEPFTASQRGRMFRNRPSDVGKGLSLSDWHRVLQYVEACHGIGIKKGEGNGK